MAQAPWCWRADAGGTLRRAGGPRRRVAVALDTAVHAGPFARRAAGGLAESDLERLAMDGELLFTTV
jgi:hypothetical protein